MSDTIEGKCSQVGVNYLVQGTAQDLTKDPNRFSCEYADFETSDIVSCSINYEICPIYQSIIHNHSDQTSDRSQHSSDLDSRP